MCLAPNHIYYLAVSWGVSLPSRSMNYIATLCTESEAHYFLFMVRKGEFLKLL